MSGVNLLEAKGRSFIEAVVQDTWFSHFNLLIKGQSLRVSFLSVPLQGHLAYLSKWPITGFFTQLDEGVRWAESPDHSSRNSSLDSGYRGAWGKGSRAGLGAQHLMSISSPSPSSMVIGSY